MTRGPMRKVASASTRLGLNRSRCPYHVRSISTRLTKSTPSHITHQTRRLAQVRPEPLSELWFTSSFPHRTPSDDVLNPNPRPGSNKDYKPPDERRLRLGKTLRILSPLLPTILTTPLPPTIVSPSISLHLFPSTHPHLPVCRGRISYRAALWTAPVAWGCVPIVGNVNLRILSERIVRSSLHVAGGTGSRDSDEDVGDEKLVVRWKSIKKHNNNSGTGSAVHSTSSTTNNQSENSGINRGLSTLLGGDKPIFNISRTDDFTGLFVFTFDAKGRIQSHTIEHADESKGEERTSRVVTVADWLLGGLRGRKQVDGLGEGGLVPGLAMRDLRVGVGAGAGVEGRERRRELERLW